MGDPANDGVGATVTGDAAAASRKVSLCFFWPLSNGQSLYSMLAKLFLRTRQKNDHHEHAQSMAVRA
jgi:hypothetical protein